MRSPGQGEGAWVWREKRGDSGHGGPCDLFRRTVNPTQLDQRSSFMFNFRFQRSPKRNGAFRTPQAFGVMFLGVMRVIPGLSPGGGGAVEHTVMKKSAP